MAEDYRKKDKEQEDSLIQLSDDTLELMLFRECVFSKRFATRIVDVIDPRWFRTSHIRMMAQIAVKWFKVNGEIIPTDIMSGALAAINNKTLVEANRMDITKAMFDFNRAKDLDLGKMDDKTRIKYIERYVKQEALRNALLDAANDLERKNTDDIIGKCLKKFEDVQKILFEEIDFGFQIDATHIDEVMEQHMDYLTNPGAVVSTGWQCIDDVTRGGFLKDGKSLYVFMGQSGIGKSNVLANLGYNFLKQDLKVMVVTMEMSQNVYLRRFDSLITKIDIDDLGLSTLAPMVKERMDKFFKVDHPNAMLFVKEYPTGSICPRNIENYIDELIDQRGIKPDVLIVDYIGIIKPNEGSSVGESAMYGDGKHVAEQLRALSYKYEIPVLSAVQCNSSGYNTEDIGMENCAESRGIVHALDFFIGMYQSEDEQKDGIFHMKILKTRFGDKGSFIFHFNKDTLEFVPELEAEGIPEDAAKDVSDSTKSQIEDKTKKSPSCQVEDDDLFGGMLNDPGNLGMP